MDKFEKVMVTLFAFFFKQIKDINQSQKRKGNGRKRASCLNGEKQRMNFKFV
jgi:hypothetical protein